MGHKIFLDLKLHDIPNTVKKGDGGSLGLDVDMCNVHAAGTKGMMQAALEGLTRADGSRPLLIAVTQLTSTSEEVMQQELWIDKPIDETVMHYEKYHGSRTGRSRMLAASRQARYMQSAEKKFFDDHRACVCGRRWEIRSV